MNGASSPAIATDLMIALPELLLAIGAMALLILGVLRAPKRNGMEGDAASFNLVYWPTILLMLGCGVLVAASPAGGEHAFNGVFVDDVFARFAKTLILFGGAIMLLLGREYLRRHRMLQFEFPVLILFATLGMCLMVSASDLIALYMGLELQSLSLYVVAAFRRDSVRSTEAGLKYFVLGALSSGLLLYGSSLVYGYTGATEFSRIAEALSGPEDPSIGLVIGLVFLLSGLAFKISAAPFHMWTPDVYEGAPAPVTAFFATAPKVAAAALLARVMTSPFGDVHDQWMQVICALAVASMFLGAFAGIGQTNLKRLLAYSSIGHMGFALVALAAGTKEGVEAMLIYLVIYLIMNIGVFAFLLTMTRGGQQVARIADLDGLGTTHPGSAAGLAVLMFSLAGIPPLWGFFAKYQAFYAAVDAGLAWLAVAGVIASVISAFYYLMIVRRMYFAEATQPLELRGGLEHRAALAIAALIMILAVAPFPPFNGGGAPEAAARAAASVLP